MVYCKCEDCGCMISLDDCEESDDGMKYKCMRCGNEGVFSWLNVLLSGVN